MDVPFTFGIAIARGTPDLQGWDRQLATVYGDWSGDHVA